MGKRRYSVLSESASHQTESKTEYKIQVSADLSTRPLHGDKRRLIIKEVKRREKNVQLCMTRIKPCKFHPEQRGLLTSRETGAIYCRVAQLIPGEDSERQEREKEVKVD